MSFEENMLKFFLASLSLLVKDVYPWCEAENQYPWSYHGPDNDPAHWGDFYPECNGTDQAPIAINDDMISLRPTESFTMHGFDQPVTKAKVQNLGWTVMIIPDDDVERYLQLDELTFNLKHIRFHFGPESHPGAENVLYGVKYPMEIQYYTYNDKEGFSAFLSTLVDVEDDDNSAFDSIVGVLSDVMYRNSSTDLQSNLDLISLLPEGHGDYFMYLGSNSVPPCETPYFWLIYKDLGKIGKDQLATFTTLYSVGEEDASDDCLMGPNARPVQVWYRRFLFFYDGGATTAGS